METKTYTPLPSFIDLLMDAVFAVDANANIVFASAACTQIFGYTPQEMIGKNMFNMMVPEDHGRTQQSINEIMSERPQTSFENRYIRKDGHVVHIMWATRWSDVEQLRIGVARDITKRKRSESVRDAIYGISEAANATNNLFTLIQHIHQIVGALLPADSFSVALYDQEKKQLSFPYSVDIHQQTAAASNPVVESIYTKIIQTGQPQLTAVCADECPYRESGLPNPNSLCSLGVPLKSHNGTIGALVIKSYPGNACYSTKDQELLQFVSNQIATAIERQQMQAKLLHMAQFDQLTGLPNRMLLYDRLKTALSSAQRRQQKLSLLYVDLDKFKDVNDTLGHTIGDLLLQEVAKRLQQSVRQSDTVARIGGDEFIVLLPDTQRPEQATRVIEKINAALAKPLTIGSKNLSIVPSIGVAHYPENGDCEQQLLKYADNAMYLNKKGKHG